VLFRFFFFFFFLLSYKGTNLTLFLQLGCFHRHYNLVFARDNWVLSVFLIAYLLLKFAGTKRPQGKMIKPQASPLFPRRYGARNFGSNGHVYAHTSMRRVFAG